MKKTSKAIGVVMLAAVMILLAACGPELPKAGSNGEEPSSASDIPVGEDSLIIGLSSNVDSFNPLQRTGFANTYAQRFMYETILDMTGPGEFQPRLGEITTEDNQTFHIALNEAASWTDGEPVTTEDVAYTIDITAHPDTITTQASFINMIEGTDENGKFIEGAEEVSGVDIIDDYTMTIATKQPVDQNYFSEFFGFYFFIAPEHIFSQYEPAELHTSEAIVRPEIFNGAYTVTNYAEGDHVELTANPDYYRGEPKISKIYMRMVDEMAMMTELQSGNIDMLAGGSVGKLSPNNIGMIRENESFSIEEAAGTNVEYLIPNTRNERWQDARVRRAVNHALDIEMAVDNLLSGNGEVVSGPYTSVSPYKSDQIQPLEYDPVKAQELLEEADFNFSEPVTLMVSTGNEAREQMADLIQQQLEAVGMTVEQVPYDITTWVSNAREGNFDLGHISIRHNYDPDVAQAFHTTGSNNMGAYSDEKLDELIIQGTAGESPKERQPIYEDFQKYFQEEMPMIPLYTEFEHAIQKNNIQGGVNEFWPETTANIHEWEISSE